jgi:hypothetical protein
MSSGVIGDRQLNSPYSVSSSLMSILILDLMDKVNPVRNSSRCDSKPSGALNPVRDLSLNGINPALRGGTPYGAEPGIILKCYLAAAAGP